jgi:hypothetical protein
MTTTSERVRGWLNTNKIYFEIATAILIGGASLVVSWAALRINERMLVATEISALPHFSLAKRARLDPESRAYIEETLVLLNNGAPVSNVTWSVKTFLVLESYTPRKTRIYVPLIGYFFAQQPTASVTGELSSIAGHQNLLKFSRLYRASLDRNAASTTEQAFLGLETISVVTYEDRFGRPSVAYFRDYSKVSEAEVKSLLEYSARAAAVDIDKTSLDEILQRSKSPNAFAVAASVR